MAGHSSTIGAVMRRRLTATLALASLALVACGSDQDPAIDVPGEDEASSASTSAPEEGSATGTGETVEFAIQLTGTAEVPGPGDEDGAGQAHVYLEPDGRICYDFIGIDGIDTPTAAHIHEGAAGVAGDVVLPLEAPTEGSLDACIDDQAELAQRIAASPAGFYVNVHNAEFEAGAVRGQLQ